MTGVRPRCDVRRRSAPGQQRPRRAHDALHDPRVLTEAPRVQLPQRDAASVFSARVVQEPLAADSVRGDDGAADSGGHLAADAAAVQDRPRSNSGDWVAGGRWRRRSRCCSWMPVKLRHRASSRREPARAPPGSPAMTGDPLTPEDARCVRPRAPRCAHRHRRLHRAPAPPAARRRARGGARRHRARDPRPTRCAPTRSRAVPYAGASRAFDPVSLSRLAEQVAADQRSATGRTIDVNVGGRWPDPRRSPMLSRVCSAT